MKTFITVHPERSGAKSRERSRMELPDAGYASYAQNERFEGITIALSIIPEKAFGRITIDLAGVNQ
ncbi:MAG: hypothetical protein WA435_13960 [Gallionellaceae bacterium]